MRFLPTSVADAWIIEPERMADDRGFFARTYCREQFEARGLNASIAQCSVSFNRRRGTLRGMHLQAPPHQEAKLVRATRGIVFDVALDLRPDSSSFLRWHAVELSAEKRNALYIPEGVAHGFLTLTDSTELLYQISVPYAAQSGLGYRYDDPAFGIRWPFAPSVVSERDRAFPKWPTP